MLVLTALGALPQIRDAADELDRHDPSPADAENVKTLPTIHQAPPGRNMLPWIRRTMESLPVVDTSLIS